MSDIVATLLLRNLQEVFGEGDPARRRTAIEDLYTEDCVVLLPIGRHVGRQALARISHRIGCIGAREFRENCVATTVFPESTGGPHADRV